MKILVVDDERAIRNSLKEILSDEGYDVDVAEDGSIAPCSGWTNIFIYPGYRFKTMNGLITNFHLPESTLIMLVSAFAGYEHTMNAYKIAVEQRYRFFSFGDSMLIL